MKLLHILSAVVLMLTFWLIIPSEPQASVMMTGSVGYFGFDILPTANFTLDQWLSNPNLWTITITNSDQKTIKSAVIYIHISSGKYDPIIDGSIRVAGPSMAFIPQLLPGQSFTVNNTMVEKGTPQMDGGEWSNEFKDEVIRIGFLPEGTYTLRFTLTGYYGSVNDPIIINDVQPENPIERDIDIKNPSPPELVSPDDMSDDTVTIPRFTWQKPAVSDFSSISKTIRVDYKLTLWKMFGEDGTPLSEEDAITRIPIWEWDSRLAAFNKESVNFNPGTAREELIGGRKYCWQVQAFDGTGRPITDINDGKSDVWQFTVQFVPPVINEPLLFFPLSFSWSPAKAGGGLLLYRVRIADNPDFINGYMVDGIFFTYFSYPNDAPPLRLGEVYYLEVQATDDSNIPLGEPVQMTFTLPTEEVILRSPRNESIPPSNTPTFSWRSNAPYHVIMIFDETSDWSYISVSIKGTTWTYDGEDLQPGKTYAWNVSPANEMGEPVGKSSATWRFTLAAEDQVTLVSPVDEAVDSIYPTFTWKEIGEGQVNYTIFIEREDGTLVHSATVSSTSYKYPQDAPVLSYAFEYYWSVSAEQNGIEIGRRSGRSFFTTPFSETGAEVVTMDEINRMIQLVLSQYPELSEFKDKILKSISDESGPLTPAAFLELFETFKIIKVSAK